MCIVTEFVELWWTFIDLSRGTGITYLGSIIDCPPGRSDDPSIIQPFDV